MGGVSLPQPTRGSGGASSAPQRGPGHSPGRKRILAYFEGHRTLFFVPVWQNLRGTICISLAPPPLLQIVGDLSNRDLHPCEQKCLPILTYGLEVMCALHKRVLQSLDFTVDRVLKKLFKSSNTVIEQCMYVFLPYRVTICIAPETFWQILQMLWWRCF